MRSGELCLCGGWLALTVTLAVPSLPAHPLRTTGCAGPAAIGLSSPRPSADMGFTEIRSQRIPDRERGESYAVLQRRGPRVPRGVCPHPETRCTGSPARGRGPGRARDRGSLGALETGEGGSRSAGSGDGLPGFRRARKPSSRRPE